MGSTNLGFHRFCKVGFGEVLSRVTLGHQLAFCPVINQVLDGDRDLGFLAAPHPALDELAIADSLSARNNLLLALVGLLNLRLWCVLVRSCGPRMGKPASGALLRILRQFVGVQRTGDRRLSRRGGGVYPGNAGIR